MAKLHAHFIVIPGIFDKKLIPRMVQLDLNYLSQVQILPWLQTNDKASVRPVNTMAQSGDVLELSLRPEVTIPWWLSIGPTPRVSGIIEYGYNTGNLLKTLPKHTP